MVNAETTASCLSIDFGERSDIHDVHVRHQSSPAPRSIPSSLSTPSSAFSSATVTTSSPPAATIPSPTALGAVNSSNRAASKKPTAASPAASSSPGKSRAMSTAVREGVTPTQRISRAKKGKRVHACNHQGCEKVFTRAEHLRRHQLNHSTEVLYTCEICDKTFVRQDLLSRHTDRHATQARKAVQTLALAQRHQHFSSHFGINRMVLAAPPPPITDYGGNAHVFESSTHAANRLSSADVGGVPQLLSGASHQSSPTTPVSAASMPGYSAGFPATLPIQHSADSPLDFTSTTESTPSPSASLRKAHLPFHLQHSEPQRQQDPYMVPVTSHAEIIQRPLAVSMEQPLYTKPMPTWENYAWLFDDSLPEVTMNMNQPALTYIHPLETSHYQNAGLSADQGAGSSVKGSAVPVFHPIDQRKCSEVLMLLGNVEELQASNCASVSSMNFYLGLYWTKFHIRYPILHRPTFLPGSEDAMLVAIVVAIGASFADGEAHQFAMALYEKVKGIILASEEQNMSNIRLHQRTLLACIFGKMRSTNSNLEDSQLDLLLLNVLRRSEAPNGDSLGRVKTYLREGLELDYHTEWQSWIDFESRKRVVLFFFLWDAQQATLFGRDMLQTAFDLRTQLPCEEFLWNSESAAEWASYIHGQPEYPGFLETIKLCLNPKRQIPAMTPLNSVFVLLGLISVGFDMYRRSSPVAPSSDDTTEKQTKLLRALENWRRRFESIMNQTLIQHWYPKMMLIYHMAYISLHTNINSLLAAAGDYRFYRRPSDANDLYRAKREIQHWANTAQARLATWHAVQTVILGLDRSHVFEELMYPWCMYVAALVCWAYGRYSTPSLSSGRVPSVAEDEVIWDAHEDMRLYIQNMGTDTWENLAHVGAPRRRTTGLLAVVHRTMEGTRLGLIQGSVEILKRLNMARTK